MSSKEKTIKSIGEEVATVPAPPLRFPEFRDAGDWKALPLGDLATITTERVGDRNHTPLSITTGVGLVSQVEKFGRVIAGSQYRNYVCLQQGDFAYNKSATNNSPQGFIARYLGSEPAAVPNSIFTCFRADIDLIDGEYLNQLFMNNLHGRWLRRFMTVGARAHGSLNIDDEDILSIPVPTPTHDLERLEQNKISECLSSLDELITAERQNLDALKDHKKGLMQCLFPAEGETTPRLRFPKFRSSPEWVSEPLGHLAIYENGKAYEPHISENGRFTVVNARFISSEGRIRKESDADLCVAGKGDVLIVLSDLPNGKALAKCFYVDTSNQYAVNQRVCRLTARRISSEFLYYALDRHPALLAYDDGLNQTHLRKEAVLACPISHPMENEEQQSIAQCLSALNDFLASQSSKITGLVGLKAALLQQLFPSMDEVQA